MKINITIDIPDSSPNYYTTQPSVPNFGWWNINPSLPLPQPPFEIGDGDFWWLHQPTCFGGRK